MSCPKRHHYVPQNYLKNFSFKKKEKFKLYVLDKISKKVFNANVEDLAVEKDFYTLDKLTDKYAWETFYATKVEPLMKEYISNVIKNCNCCVIKNEAMILNRDMKAKLAKTIIYQLLRDKQTREFEHTIFEKYIPEVLRETKQQFKKMENEKNINLLKDNKVDDYIFKLVSMNLSLDQELIDTIFKTIVNRCWIIYKIIGNQEFVTSDHPVMFINSETSDATPFHNGISDNRTVIFYPLSSKIMIALYANDTLLGSYSGYDSKILFIDSNKEYNFINHINRKQLEQCNRHIFGKSENIIKSIL